jgi:hypothetical protein
MFGNIRIWKGAVLEIEDGVSICLVLIWKSQVLLLIFLYHEHNN